MLRIHHLYVLLIITLPVVDGILRVRLGAGWEPSVILAILLYFSAISIYRRFIPIRSTLRWMLVPAALLCMSNFFGYVYFSEGYSLGAENIEQIRSVEARMLVESVRYIVCVFVFLFTFFYLNTVEKIVSTASVFVFASLIEGVYGLYEFVVKLSGMAGVFPLLRGTEGNVHSILRSYGTFFEPSNFGQFMACSVFFYIGYLSLVARLGCQRNFLVRWKYVVFSVFILSILVSFSRTAFLGLLFGVIFKILVDLFSGSGVRFRTGLYWAVGVVMMGMACVALVVQLVSDKYLNRWIAFTLDFSSDINYENTALSRGKSLFELGYGAIDLIMNYPLGIGQGMAYLESPFTPFIVRFPLELGVIASLFFAGILAFILFSSVRGRGLGNLFLPSIACLVVCFFNYNSTNHVWIWFLLGLFFRVSCLVWVRKADENFSCYYHDQPRWGGESS